MRARPFAREAASGVIAFALIVCSTQLTRGADWPARIFAPYVYLGAGDDFKLTDCDDSSGQKFYTLAFIIADKQNSPAWDGRWPITQNLYADQIAAIRKRGGNVICSFGGEAGSELAIVDHDAASLQSKYQAVIDRYQFTWLDFDIEGKALHNTDANRRRNLVLAKLQAKNPGLRITFTLPVDPDGIPADAQKLLADAKARGVSINSANVMTMYFGPRFSKGKKLSDVCIASALKAHEQCQQIDERIQIGLTPLIGRNEEMNETFAVDDAKTLANWAKSQPWVCSLSFWCSNRDAGKAGKKDGNTSSGVEQQAWEFTRAFQPFAAQ